MYAADKAWMLLLCSIVGFFALLMVFSKITRVLADYPSIPPKQLQNASLRTVATHSPYCVVDPTCVNIITGNMQPYIAHLPSVAAPHDQNQSSSALSSKNFAWPNYWLFMTMLLVAVAICVFIVNDDLRRLFLSVPLAWLIEEVGRWSTVNLGQEVYAWTVVLLGFSVLLLGCVYLVTKKLFMKKRSHSISDTSGAG
jgi:hypothetical protein